MSIAKRGLIAPQNKFLEDLIARSKNLDNCFVLANAKQEDTPVIYCSDGFCSLTGYKRSEILHKPADCEYLYGDETDQTKVEELGAAIDNKVKLKHEVTLYKKDGTRFIAVILVAPIKNDEEDVIMFLITLRDITKLRERTRGRGRSFISALNPRFDRHTENSNSNNNVSNGVEPDDDVQNDSANVFFSKHRFKGFALTPGSHEIRKQEIAHLSMLDTELPDYKRESPRSPPGIILHYCTSKIIWNWVLLFFTFYTAVFVPLQLAFTIQDDNEKTALLIMDCIVDVIFLADIAINFRTTFVDRTGYVVSLPRLIAKNYLSGWFIIDLIAALPYEILTVSEETKHIYDGFKVLRLLRLTRFIRKFNEHVEYGPRMIVLLMFTYVLVAHWLACIWYSIGFYECRSFGWLHLLAEQSGLVANVSNNIANDSICRQIDVGAAYATSLYFTMSSLTTVGFGNVSANTTGEKVFSIIVMVIGSLMSAFIFGNVTAILQEIYSSTQRYHAILKDMKRFSRIYNLPKILRRRVEDYFISSWAITKGIDTQEMLKYWPKEIRAEIKMHMNRKILRDAPCFNNASEGCLRQLAERFKMQHTGPGDVLIHVGQSLSELYFIACGSFEVYSSDVGVTCILTKGDVFGDDIIKNKSLGRAHSMVRALTYCDLHVISRKHLLEVANLYPEWGPIFSEKLNLTCVLRDGSYDNLAARPITICDDHNGQMVNIQELYKRNEQESNFPPQSSDRISLIHRRLQGSSSSDITNFSRAAFVSQRMSTTRGSQPDLSNNDEDYTTSLRAQLRRNSSRRDSSHLEGISVSAVNKAPSNPELPEEVFESAPKAVQQLIDIHTELQQDVTNLHNKMIKFDRLLKAWSQEVNHHLNLPESKHSDISKAENKISGLTSETVL